MTPNLPASLRMRTKRVWGDDFSQPDLNTNWYQDTFEKDDLHRTGYKHLELDGTINYALEGIKVPGRHAALVNDHRDKVQFVRDGMLVMRMHAVAGHNVYRDDIKGRDGKIIPFSKWTPYIPWLSTWTRKWSEHHKRHVTDWEHTRMTFGKGSIVEARVNFEGQCMGGVRWSLWAMAATEAGVEDLPDKPAKVLAGTEYDDDPITVEIDFPEVENPQEHDSNYGYNASCKIVGGDAGDTPDGTKDLRDFDIDLRKGWHTFTLVWRHDGTLEFWCDGKLINTDSRMVDCKMYLIVSAEACSGLKDPDEGNVANHENIMAGVKAPRDDGLTARCWLHDIHLIDKHEVLVDYIYVYDILEAGELSPDDTDSTNLAILGVKVEEVSPTPVEIDANDLTQALPDQVEDVIALCDRYELKLRDMQTKLANIVNRHNKVVGRNKGLKQQLLVAKSALKDITTDATAVKLELAELKAKHVEDAIQISDLQRVNEGLTNANSMLASNPKTDVGTSLRKRLRATLNRARSSGVL